jgi:hypothetical protein
MERIEMDHNASNEVRLRHCPIPRYRFRREPSWQDAEGRKNTLVRRLVRLSTLKEAINRVKSQPLPIRSYRRPERQCRSGTTGKPLS